MDLNCARCALPVLPVLIFCTRSSFGATSSTLLGTGLHLGILLSGPIFSSEDFAWGFTMPTMSLFTGFEPSDFFLPLPTISRVLFARFLQSAVNFPPPFGQSSHFWCHVLPLSLCATSHLWLDGSPSIKMSTSFRYS